MNVMNDRQTAGVFASSMMALLDRVEYRRVTEADDFAVVERLRRASYTSREFIASDMPYDYLDADDRADNCHVFTVHADGKLLSTIRVHIVSRGHLHGPTAHYFPDRARSLVETGQIYVDPSRFAADSAMLWQYPALPFLTLRIAVMACEFFGAEYCMSCVRADVASFYRRTFGAIEMEPPTAIPGYAVPLMLLGARDGDVRQMMERRYPFFRSLQSEQKMMFAPESELAYPPLTVLPSARLANRGLIQ